MGCKELIKGEKKGGLLPNLHTRVFIRAYKSNWEIKFVKFVFIWLLERDIKELSTFASIKNKKCSSFQFINYPILDICMHYIIPDRSRL